MLTLRQTDPYQLHNLYPSTHGSAGHRGQEFQILGRNLSQVIKRLDSLLLVLKSCQGSTCIVPWESLHPGQSIHSLRDALDARFDLVYSQQPQVSFDRCEDGYIVESEGPQEPLTMRYGVPWDVWT